MRTIIALLWLASLLPFNATAGDTEDLATMLDAFLAHADEASAHARFWADDLVYTSSAGTRTNKAEIMAGFDDAAAQADGEDAPDYRAEDVDIRLYGDASVVVFRLVAVSADESGTVTEQSYFNTGTFIRRDGRWQAVAWQATRIPE